MVELAGVEPASSGLQPDALPAELRFPMAESAELESDAAVSTIRLAGGPWSSQVHSPYLVMPAGLEPAD